MFPSDIDKVKLREVEGVELVLPIYADVRVLIESLFYQDILYRRFVIQLIFDSIIDNFNLGAGQGENLSNIFVDQISRFLKSHPNIRFADLTRDELIEDAEELHSLFYRYYRREIRGAFPESPRIDLVTLRHGGLHIRATQFLR